MEFIPQFSYQVGPMNLNRARGDWRRLRQTVTLRLEGLDAAGRESVKGRVAELSGFVAARNAETRQEPLPDDFPVMVAPVSDVKPKKSDPTSLILSMEPGCLGSSAPVRDRAVREFTGAIGDFLLGINTSRETTEPTPSEASTDTASAEERIKGFPRVLASHLDITPEATVPTAPAALDEVSAPALPAPKGFEKLVLGSVRVG